MTGDGYYPNSRCFSHYRDNKRDFRILLKKVSHGQNWEQLEKQTKIDWNDCQLLVWNFSTSFEVYPLIYPIGSMYGIYTWLIFMCLHLFYVVNDKSASCPFPVFSVAALDFFTLSPITMEVENGCI